MKCQLVNWWLLARILTDRRGWYRAGPLNYPGLLDNKAQCTPVLELQSLQYCSLLSGYLEFNLKQQPAQPPAQQTVLVSCVWPSLVSEHKDIVCADSGRWTTNLRPFINLQTSSHLCPSVCSSQVYKIFPLSLPPSLYISYLARKLNDVKGDYKCFYWN